MASNQNVTASKPKKGGAIFCAALGTTLPTSATAALDQAFVSLGFVSEDGVVNSNSPSSESVKAWGGDEVLYYQTKKPDTFKFALLEAMNPAVLKAVYGDKNVTGDISTGITVKANSEEQADRCWVIDMILKGGAAKRVVIPCAKVISVGDITYKDNATVGYDTTIGATPDSDGNTHYEYIVKTTGEG
jgi:hypothetical protein